MRRPSRRKCVAKSLIRHRRMLRARNAKLFKPLARRFVLNKFEPKPWWRPARTTYSYRRRIHLGWLIAFRMQSLQRFLVWVTERFGRLRKRQPDLSLISYPIRCTDLTPADRTMSGGPSECPLCADTVDKLRSRAASRK